MEFSFAPPIPDKCVGCTFAARCAANLALGHETLQVMAENDFRLDEQLAEQAATADRPEVYEPAIKIIRRLHATTQAGAGNVLHSREVHLQQAWEACGGYNPGGQTCGMPAGVKSQLT